MCIYIYVYMYMYVHTIYHTRIRRHIYTRTPAYIYPMTCIHCDHLAAHGSPATVCERLLFGIYRTRIYRHIYAYACVYASDDLYPQRSPSSP